MADLSEEDDNMQNNSGSMDEGEDEDQEDDGEFQQEELAKLNRPELLQIITEIWQQKKKNNENLIKLSTEIQQTKDETKKIRERMAIESNDLNVIGNDIRKIEDKIKDLTQAGKTGNRDNEGGDGKGDGKQDNNAKQNDKDGADPFQKIENSQLFNNLAQYLSGQILDDVNNDAELLLAIQETKQVVESVQVKLLNFDPSHQTDFADMQAFTATFRIYKNTKFADLKQAACRFWKKLDQSFELTDEYYNNLDTFQGTICDFYGGSYSPLNEENLAIVYLYESNQHQQEINSLQIQSIFIKGKSKEGQGDGAETKGNNDQNRNQIEPKYIVHMLPGLKTYQEPTRKELQEFVKKIDPTKSKINNIITLIFGLFCLSSTLAFMQLRYGNSMLYELLKQVQLFTIASISASDSSENIDLKPANIETRRDLLKYLEEYVP